MAVMVDGRYRQQSATRLAVMGCLSLIVSCNGETAPRGQAADAGRAWETGDAGAHVLVRSDSIVPTPRKADPDALGELLRAAPKDQPAPTAPDGGTLVGTDTELDPVDPGAQATASTTPTTSAEAPTPAAIRAGRMRVRRELSDPAIERAAREQLYWPLVDKCRDENGGILPPDSITLVFTIRSDGSVDPASVAATANDKRYEAAAECVVRTFSAIPFRGPAGALGQHSRVMATLPSVD